MAEGDEVEAKYECCWPLLRWTFLKVSVCLWKKKNSPSRVGKERGKGWKWAKNSNIF